MSSPVTTTPPAAAGLPSGTMGGERKRMLEQVTLGVFIVVPFLAVLAGDPASPGAGGSAGSTSCSSCVMYVVTGARHHGRLPPLLHPRLVQGQPAAASRARRSRARWPSRARSIRWVADHRKHHTFSDAEGDPHSPWRLRRQPVPAPDEGPLLRAHRLAVRRRADLAASKYAPDLLEDRDIVRISRAFPAVVARLAAAPAAARRADDLVVAGRADRVLLGRPGPGRPAAPRHLVDQLDLPRLSASARSSRRDQSGNVWWLAILSFGESWHNLHHARPDVRPARRAQGSGRHPARGLICWPSRSSAGRTTCAGRSRSASTPRRAATTD